MALNAEVVEERLINIQTQLNRFIAHLESEQRISVNQGKAIDRLEKWLDRLEKGNDKHEKILYNGGEGIIRRVDHIIQAEVLREKHAKKFQWTFSNVLAIASLLSTILLGLLMFAK